jgi:hypothetical protein
MNAWSRNDNALPTCRAQQTHLETGIPPLYIHRCHGTPQAQDARIPGPKDEAQTGE